MSRDKDTEGFATESKGTIKRNSKSHSNGNAHVGIEGDEMAIVSAMDGGSKTNNAIDAPAESKAGITARGMQVLVLLAVQVSSAQSCR